MFPRSTLPVMVEVHDNVCKAVHERIVPMELPSSLCHPNLINPAPMNVAFLEKEKPR